MAAVMQSSNNMMMSSMGSTMTMTITTMAQMGWVSYFFSGFILAKVPFPLTQKFRNMIQRGVELESLDVRYLSSLSFYFLIMFGLGSLQQILMEP